MKDEGWVHAVRKIGRPPKDERLREIAEAAELDQRTVLENTRRLIEGLGLRDEMVKALSQ